MSEQQLIDLLLVACIVLNTINNIRLSKRIKGLESELESEISNLSLRTGEF